MKQLQLRHTQLTAQRKFLLGASTPYNVTQQQRDLAAANSTELSALVGYSTARIALDQATGSTLEANHVSIDQANGGVVARPSALPNPLPANPLPPAAPPAR